MSARRGPIVLLATLLAATAAAQEWVVDVAGDDAGPGNAEHPLRTAEGAQRRLAATLAGSRRGAHTIRFRAGVHLLTRTFAITPADVPDDGLTLAGEPGSVLSGGDPAGWEPDGRGRWRLRGRPPLALPSTGISLDLTPLPATRWPAEGGAQVAEIEVDGRLRIDPPPPPGWGELVLSHDWGTCRAWVHCDHGRIPLPAGLRWPGHEGIAASRGRQVVIDGLAMPASDRARWFVADGRLCLAAELPPPGTTWLHRLEEVLVLAGNPEAPLKGVTVSGLTIAHAAWLRPPGGLAGIQAGHVAVGGRETPVGALPGAVRLAWAQGTRLSDLRVVACDGSGIVVGAGCRGVVVERSLVEEVGGCGMVIGWRGGSGEIAALAAPWAAGGAPFGTVVRRCRVARCARLDWGSVGIADVLAEGSRIEHNLVEDLPYSGISVGFRWDTSGTTQRRTLVLGNRVQRVAQRLADAGGIYTLGWQPGTVLRGNLVEQVGRHPLAQGAPNAGLFFDNGSKGILVEGNVVARVDGESMRWNGCAPSWIILGANHMVQKDETITLPPAVAEGVGP
ncbi:MAG: hypothetical protein L6R48_18940 [Planctomycetes bacterium]|nr:hypothetical protein [Planctomycetota bacterium]